MEWCKTMLDLPDERERVLLCFQDGTMAVGFLEHYYEDTDEAVWKTCHDEGEWDYCESEPVWWAKLPKAPGVR